MKASNTDLIIFASATAKSGSEAALEQALRDVAAPTRAQQGCAGFTLLRANGRADTILAIERWASAADHQRHLQGAHVQALMQKMGTVLAGPPDIVSYSVVDA